MTSRSRSKLPFNCRLTQQVAQFAVVDAHVAVDQFVRHGPVRDGVLQVVEHHVRVVEIRLGALGEPIAVVPLPHEGQGGVDLLIEHADAAVGLEQAPHFRREAEDLVEVGFQADVGADVEAAGDVVHGHRRDAGDEQALQTAAGAFGAALEGREEVAVEATAVREGVVRFGAVMRQDGVGEVVVLVDEHVQRNTVVARVPEQLGKLGSDGRRREDVPQRRFGKQVGMTP